MRRPSASSRDAFLAAFFAALRKRNSLRFRAGVFRAALIGAFGGVVLAALLRAPVPHSPLHYATTPAYAAPADEGPHGFAGLVNQVKGAVVSVRVKIDQSGNVRSGLPFRPGSPLYKFFFPNDKQRQQVLVGEGSGFFISADGYIVTNNHVADHAQSVQITTDDGTLYTAKVVGTDERSDLALLKVDADKQFPFVKFAEQRPSVGDWVVAVGNPFGLGGTVTAGIVSAQARDIGLNPYGDYLQIDAPINRGNSGGPAFNENGDVVGVNTAIFSPSGGSRLDRRRRAAGNAGDCREPRHEKGRRRVGRSATSA
jgi:serine protease Do